MLKKHKRACFRKLGDISVTEMRNDLAPDVNPFKSPLFHAEPKTNELELAEVEKQKKCVLKKAMSETTARYFFIPKSDRKLRLYIDNRMLNLINIKD